MEKDIERKLNDLDDGQKEVLRRLEEMKKNIRDVVTEIGGVPDSEFREPDRRTIRWRIHMLETDRTTAQAAQAAVDAAKALHDASTEKRFSHREKIGAVILAAASVLSPYLAPLIYHH